MIVLYLWILLSLSIYKLYNCRIYNVAITLIKFCFKFLFGEYLMILILSKI